MSCAANVVLGESQRVLTVLQQHEQFHHDDILAQFRALRELLIVSEVDLERLSPLPLFQPFLAVIQRREVNDVVVSEVLASIQTMLASNIIVLHSVGAQQTVRTVANAVTGCQYQVTDSDTDEVAQMRLVEALLACLECRASRMLGAKISADIFATCFQICDSRRSRVLRAFVVRALERSLIFIFTDEDREVGDRKTETCNSQVPQMNSEKSEYYGSLVESSVEIHVSESKEALLPPEEFATCELPQCRARILGFLSQGLDPSVSARTSKLFQAVQNRRSRTQAHTAHSLDEAASIPVGDSSERVLLCLRLLDAALRTVREDALASPTVLDVICCSVLRRLLTLATTHVAVSSDATTDSSAAVACCPSSAPPELMLTLRLVLRCLSFPQLREHLDVPLEMFWERVFLPSLPGERRTELSHELHESIGGAASSATTSESVEAQEVEADDMMGMVASPATDIVLESFCELSSLPSFLPELYARQECCPISTNVVQESVSRIASAFSAPRDERPLSRKLWLCVQIILNHLRFMGRRAKVLEHGTTDAGAVEIAGLLWTQKQRKARLSMCAETWGRGGWKSGVRALRTEGFLSPKTSCLYEKDDEANLLMDDASALAVFLRLVRSVDPRAVGEFLGRDVPLSKETLKAYLSLFNFDGMSLLSALRVFLESFRLPGEGQQIDRIVEAFAACAWSTSADKDLFSGPDVPYVLSYSIIMLNTDLHNPHIRPEKRMTSLQYVQMNRYYSDEVNRGRSLPVHFLEKIYFEVRSQEIRISAEHAGAHLTEDVWMDLLWKSSEAWVKDKSPTVKSHSRKNAIFQAVQDIGPRTSAMTELFRRQKPPSGHAAALCDKHLFTLIGRPSIFALMQAFHTASSRQQVELILRGLSDCAEICARHHVEGGDAYNKALELLAELTTLLREPTDAQHTRWTANAAENCSIRPRNRNIGLGKEGVAQQDCQADCEVEARSMPSLHTPLHCDVGSARPQVSVLPLSQRSGCRRSSDSQVHRFGTDLKAQLSLATFLDVARRLGKHTRGGWLCVVRVIAVLYRLGLLDPGWPRAFTCELLDARGCVIFRRAVRHAQRVIMTPRDAPGVTTPQKAAGFLGWAASIFSSVQMKLSSGPLPHSAHHNCEEEQMGISRVDNGCSVATPASCTSDALSSSFFTRTSDVSEEDARSTSPDHAVSLSRTSKVSSKYAECGNAALRASLQCIQALRLDRFIDSFGALGVESLERLMSILTAPLNMDVTGENIHNKCSAFGVSTPNMSSLSECNSSPAAPANIGTDFRCKNIENDQNQEIAEDSFQSTTLCCRLIVELCLRNVPHIARIWSSAGRYLSQALSGGNARQLSALTSESMCGTLLVVVECLRTNCANRAEAVAIDALRSLELVRGFPLWARSALLPQLAKGLLECVGAALKADDITEATWNALLNAVAFCVEDACVSYRAKAASIEGSQLAVMMCRAAAATVTRTLEILSRAYNDSSTLPLRILPVRLLDALATVVRTNLPPCGGRSAVCSGTTGAPEVLASPSSPSNYHRCALGLLRTARARLDDAAPLMAQNLLDSGSDVDHEHSTDAWTLGTLALMRNLSLLSRPSVCKFPKAHQVCLEELTGLVKGLLHDDRRAVFPTVQWSVSLDQHLLPLVEKTAIDATALFHQFEGEGINSRASASPGLVQGSGTIDGDREGFVFVHTTTDATFATLPQESGASRESQTTVCLKSGSGFTNGHASGRPGAHITKLSQAETAIHASSIVHNVFASRASCLEALNSDDFRNFVLRLLRSLKLMIAHPVIRSAARLQLSEFLKVIASCDHALWREARVEMESLCPGLEVRRKQSELC